jgi:hypothetical protein
MGAFLREIPACEAILRTYNFAMTNDIITGIRQGIQDFVAPEIRELKGSIAALDARITSLEKVMDSRFKEMDSRFKEVDSRMNALDSKWDARFGEINAKLDALLKIHDFEVRLARLEAQKSA